jgi:hypothetical protein
MVIKVRPRVTLILAVGDIKPGIRPKRLQKRVGKKETTTFGL